MQEPHCLAPLSAGRPEFSTDLEKSTWGWWRHTTTSRVSFNPRVGWAAHFCRSNRMKISRPHEANMDLRFCGRKNLWFKNKQSRPAVHKASRLLPLPALPLSSAWAHWWMKVRVGKWGGRNKGSQWTFCVKGGLRLWQIQFCYFSQRPAGSLIHLPLWCGGLPDTFTNKTPWNYRMVFSVQVRSQEKLLKTLRAWGLEIPDRGREQGTGWARTQKWENVKRKSMRCHEIVPPIQL